MLVGILFAAVAMILNSIGALLQAEGAITAATAKEVLQVAFESGETP